jgi:hypothetical protein
MRHLALTGPRGLASSLSAITLFAVLAGCGDGGGGTRSDAGGGAGGTGGTAGAGGAGGTAGGAGGTAGGAGGTAGTGGTGGGSGATGDGGMTDAAGSSMMGVPAGGDHFCRTDVTEPGAWAFGAQIKCKATFAKMPPLTADQRKALDFYCEPPYSTIVTDCPRADAVGYCLGADSPAIPTRTYTLVNKSSITPDTTALSLNGPAICAGAAYDMTGKPLISKCTGSVKATVDGTALDFSTNLVCWYKSNGTKSQYFVQAQDASKTKSFNVNILQQGGMYSVPGNALAPGFSYIEGNSPFAFPKNADSIPVMVTKFLPAGGGLAGTFSPGEVYSQPGGKGAGPHTITGGTIDIVITP